MNRLRCIAAETYKCVNNMSPLYLRDLVDVKQTKYSFRYENTVKIPTVRTVRYVQRSFRFESVSVWNSLSNELRTATIFWKFKGLIRTWVAVEKIRIVSCVVLTVSFMICVFMLRFFFICMCFVFSAWFYFAWSVFFLYRFSWCRPLVGNTCLSLLSLSLTYYIFYQNILTHF